MGLDMEIGRHRGIDCGGLDYGMGIATGWKVGGPVIAGLRTDVRCILNDFGGFRGYLCGFLGVHHRPNISLFL